MTNSLSKPTLATFLKWVIPLYAFTSLLGLWYQGSEWLLVAACLLCLPLIPGVLALRIRDIIQLKRGLPTNRNLSNYLLLLGCCGISLAGYFAGSLLLFLVATAVSLTIGAKERQRSIYNFALFPFIERTEKQ